MEGAGWGRGGLLSFSTDSDKGRRKSLYSLSLFKNKMLTPLLKKKPFSFSSHSSPLSSTWLEDLPCAPGSEGTHEKSNTALSLSSSLLSCLSKISSILLGKQQHALKIMSQTNVSKTTWQAWNKRTAVATFSGTGTVRSCSSQQPGRKARQKAGEKQVRGTGLHHAIISSHLLSYTFLSL